MKHPDTANAGAGRTDALRVESPGARPGTRVASVAVALLLLVPVGCRRSERRVASAQAPAESGAPAPEKEEPPHIRETAESGRAPFEGLKEPRDAAVDSRGRIWIADFGHSRLRIFDRDGGYLGGWGGRGNGTYGFQDPCAVAIRGEDVYVADTWNGRIQHFSLSGDWKGTAAGLFGPRGVAVGPDGKVWVTDTGNHQVRSYDSALGAFELIGKRGSGLGEFSSPVGIAVGPAGKIYVADMGNRRITVLAADGKFDRSWPISGWNEAVEPHIEVDEDGSIYVTDPGSAGAVLHLDREGGVNRSWTTGGKGERFSLPTGLALDRPERILYVVNRGNNSVSRVPLGVPNKP
jgi:DNA-binding beta-propeller fold protein YncE